MIESSRITTGLYQGSQPKPGDHVRLAGFDVLVLCAAEYQPQPEHYPGVKIIYCPLIDNQGKHIPTPEELERAYIAGKRVASAVKRKKRVLVTCQAGLNRSGMVTAIALRGIFGTSGSSAVRHVQACRPDALFNVHFVRAIEALPPRRAEQPK